jgi:probable addiction module antidote protein
MLEILKDDLNDDEFVRAYLREALRDGGEATFYAAIGNVIKARTGMTKVSEEVGANRESLYRAFSEKGNPGFGTVLKTLQALGLELDISTADSALAA